MSLSTRALLLVAQKHLAEHPDELTVAPNDLVHFMWPDEEDAYADSLWVRQLEGDRRTGRVPVSKMMLVHDDNELSNSLGALLTASKGLPRKIMQVITASTYATNMGDEERLRSRLQQSQQMIAELMLSYQRVSDHFANLLARPQEVIDDDDKLDPLIAQTKVEKESPQDEEAEFHAWRDTVSTLPATEGQLLGRSPKPLPEDSDYAAVPTAPEEDYNELFESGTRAIKLDGEVNDEEDGADDDDDDSGYWERLTAYTDVLAAQALAPQRPTPGAYRRFFQTGLRDFEGSSDYLAAVGPAAFSHPTPRKRKSIEDENDENDNVERLEVMAIRFPFH
jgi:hypothetical protein